MLTGDGDITLEKGDLAIIPPDYQHTVIYTDTDSEKWVSIAVGCTKIENRTGNDLWRKYRHLFKITSPLIFRATGDLVDEVSALHDLVNMTDSVSSVLRLALFVDNLSTREYEELRGEEGERKRELTAEGLDDVRFAILNDIVSRRYTENIDPGEVADCLYISRRHLDRIMKSRFGSTLRELINGKRLDFSKRLLEEDDSPLEKVASTSGFSSREVFCRAFRDKFGISPSDYRKNARKYN
jgi:AraC-like DNA-binding protein